MSLVVNSNIAGLNAGRSLGIADRQLTASVERLSSGLRINRAADDASNLAISEVMRAQIGGLKVALRNTRDGISVLQTAEGALTEVHDVLHRMRDLAVQAANDGALDPDARAAVQAEMGQLRDELDRIAGTTSFNGRRLLDGSYRGTFQVGADVGQTLAIDVRSGTSAAALGVAGVDVTARDGGTTARTASAAPSAGSPSAVTLGSSTLTGGDFDRLDGAVSYRGRTLDLASIRFRDTDSAAQRLDRVNAALTATFGAGAVTATNSGGLVVTGTAPPSGASAQELAAVTVGFTPATGASSAIAAIDAAIGQVSVIRGDLGAVQNRFEHNVAKLGAALDNTAASESRIRDTDMATEMTAFSRTQILNQAGTAMLAQANQSPRGVLQLLA
ncbi:flagellin N-terminal helical domain-containing protein [Modestobacter sp. VKM Ac-2977]|uniref:flagellin N-terminal helical domain-containing protein n=1 Tax=Modestobacter sp. VKM Ac-2977 TaxID=3004131 RepID=UPI0022AB24E8|nr:flagellin [Modestobacter sp. VKM Ac-2977]